MPNSTSLRRETESARSSTSPAATGATTGRQPGRPARDWRRNPYYLALALIAISIGGGFGYRWPGESWGENVGISFAGAATGMLIALARHRYYQRR